MPEPIDELVQRWRQDPSPVATIALCDALRSTPRGPLVQQVGEFATQRHASDVSVLVSVARMYIEASRFGDAQTVLVAAGKHAPRDGNVYRWLGEVLLRRGDASRAEKVLERAIQLGASGADPRLWLDRARVYKTMQSTAGTRAVAAEVAHTAAKAAPRPPEDSLSDDSSTTSVLVRETTEDSSTTTVHVRAEVTGAAPAQRKGAYDDVEDEPTRARPAPSIPLAALPSPLQALSPRRPPLPASGAPPPRREYSQEAVTAPTPFTPMDPRAMRAPEPSASGEIEITGPGPVPTAPPLPRRQGAPFDPVSNGVSPIASTFARPPPSSRPLSGRPLVPHPRDVLDALSLAGVYEPPADRAAAAAAWAKAERGPKRKGAPTLIVGMVLFLGASVGTYLFYRQKRAEEHVQAEAILTTVEAAIEEGKPTTLTVTEDQLKTAFKLESRSPRAALDWAHERAAVGLEKGGGDIAFEDAMSRAKELGLSEDKYAFAHVASFLFQGDTAGAAAALARWDGPAGGDAFYQMVAGATLERAGDARAKDRYATAAKLDPQLVIAQVAQARVTAIEGDTQEAMKLAQALRKTLPDRAEPEALVALAWGRDPNRESIPVPPEVDGVGKRADELPSGLRFVPPAVAALRASDKHADDEARAQIVKGLAVTESPGAAVWLGTIALPLGDETLARRCALAALQLSAVYEPARALAARVALLGGRLDEALKATEDLDPTSPDVAVVRAAAAYERVDVDGLLRALEAVPPDAKKLPFLDALNQAGAALAGKLPLDAAKIATMAGDDAPWSDLVAMDVALDEGDLASADKIAASWGKDSESKALRAVRLARLARYEGKLDAADALSLTAFEHGTVTPRVLWERVFTLVARGKTGEVGPLLSHYPLVLGPVATWLSAFATATGGNVEGAKGRTASSDPPPGAAPLEVRAVAAAAFGAMKDKKRGVDYVKETLATAGQHPDVVAAAVALGFRKVEHGRRPPTYEAP